MSYVWDKIKDAGEAALGAVVPGFQVVDALAAGSKQSVPGFVGDVLEGLGDVATDPYGREYSSHEALLAREHQTAERLAAEQFSAIEAQKARKFNASEALLSRQHSEYLSATEYQRKMNSMREAGLNPILAAGGWGAGSQVPSSAQAQGPAASSHGGGGAMASAATMAPLQAMLLAAQIRDISSASKLKDEQAKDLEITRDPRVNELTAREKQLNAMVDDLRASVQQKKALTDEVNKRIEKLNHEIMSAKSKAEVDKAVAEFQTGVGGDIQRWSDAVGLKGRDVTHLIGAIVGLGKFAKFFSSGRQTTVRGQPDIIIPEGAKQRPFEIIIPPNWK